jgi:hypothetical protein
MAPASYEAPPPDTTNEPKSLPPQAPLPDDGMGTGPEGPGSQEPGMLQKASPTAAPPSVGGTGGMGGTGGLPSTPSRGGMSGKRSIH